MSDGKGYRVIVKINLPPEENYHSGHSLIVQGETPEQVELSIARLIETTPDLGVPSQNAIDQARFILLRFTEFASGGAAKQALGNGTAVAPAQEKAGAGAADTTKKDAAAPAAETDTASAPQPATDLASQKVLEAVAKKTGKTIEELGELTKVQAAEMLKGGGK